MKKKYFLNFFYLLLWLFPLGYFIKDFFRFSLSEILNLDLTSFYSSLIQGVLTTFFSFIIALIPGYYCAYNKDKISDTLKNLIFIPFVFPVISTVLSFSIIYNFQIFKSFNYTLSGIIIANSFYNSPLFLKYIYEALSSIPKEIEEEASLEGVGEWTIFYKIKLPLIFPAIIRGGFLVFIYSFTSFILVIALGGLKYSTMEAEIATTLLGSLNFNKVLILGFFQCGILLFLNTALKYIPQYELSGKGYSKKLPPFFKCFTIFYIIFEISVIGISFVFSFFNFYLGKFSFNHFSRIFSQDFNQEFPILKGVFNSTLLSFTGAFIVTIVAYLLIRNFNKFTDALVFSTMGFSTGFLGILLIYLNISLNIPLWVLILQGYLLITLPIGYSFLFHYIHKFPKEILEAGEIDGVVGYKRFLYLELPNLKNVFLGVFLQIFAILFGEFTLSYTMQLGENFPTIALVNYSLISSKRFLESSSLNSFLLIFILSIFILSQKILEKSE